MVVSQMPKTCAIQSPLEIINIDTSNYFFFNSRGLPMVWKKQWTNKLVPAPIDQMLIFEGLNFKIYQPCSIICVLSNHIQSEMMMIYIIFRTILLYLLCPYYTHGGYPCNFIPNYMPLAAIRSSYNLVHAPIFNFYDLSSS